MILPKSIIEILGNYELVFNGQQRRDNGKFCRLHLGFRHGLQFYGLGSTCPVLEWSFYFLTITGSNRTWISDIQVWQWKQYSYLIFSFFHFWVPENDTYWCRKWRSFQSMIWMLHCTILSTKMTKWLSILVFNIIWKRHV